MEKYEQQYGKNVENMWTRGDVTVKEMSKKRSQVF